LQRDTIDILNFAFMQEALEADSAYMDRIGDNIQRLKHEGLIRFASADTFSGQHVYLQQIGSGHFDSIFIHYNVTEKAIEENVVPNAVRQGMAILTREVFRKGQLFRMAAEAGIFDRGAVARAAIKWVLQNDDVSSAVLGVSSVEQLEEDIAVLDEAAMTGEDQAIIVAICATELFKSEYGRRYARFLGLG
jgi:aryl-alcohol dehydrogenase-like predicted oxidoreductase